MKLTDLLNKTIKVPVITYPKVKETKDIMAILDKEEERRLKDE